MSEDRRKPLVKRHENTLLAVVSVGSLFLLWWILAATGAVNTILLPSPVTVAEAFMESLADGTIFLHLWASMLRVIEGFLLGFLVAVPIGMLMSTSSLAYRLIDPVVEFLRPVPPIAIIPLAILWFGIGETSKVFIIAYGAFFPVLVNTIAGFADVDPVLIRAARTLGAGRWQIFRDVVLRSAIPMIVVGARLGIGMAFIVLVAAELIASSRGLGYMINDARYNFRTDIVFLGIIMIGLVGLFLNKLLLVTERRLLRWREV